MSRPAAYVHALRLALADRADPAKAGPMHAYLKAQFSFHGIQTPQRRALVRAFIAEHGLPTAGDLQEVVLTLWAAPKRECQYAALDLLDRSAGRIAPAAIEWLEQLVLTKSWWDTVDALAAGPIGSLLRRYPELKVPAVARWRSSDHLWLRRTALLFQLRYKTATDADLLFALCRENCTSKEFFLRKAIGWSLREYSKVDPAAVRRFVDSTDLAPLSRREALRRLGNLGCNLENQDLRVIDTRAYNNVR